MSKAAALAVMIITWDGGGVIRDYLDKAEHVLATNTPVVIKGDCYSACTIFADRARNQVCVTPEARMFFHAGTVTSTKARFQIPYSTDIAQIVGKQPIDGWKVITHPLTTEIWRPCTP